jgi:hypothetical protein
VTQPLAAAPPPSPNPASLAPSWAPIAAVLATLVAATLSALVWHSNQRPIVDAWVLHAMGAHDDTEEFRLATEVATCLRAVTVGGVLASSVAWTVLRRWNAAVLALLAPTITFAMDKLLKPLVARRAPASTVFHYSSGHVAEAIGQPGQGQAAEGSQPDGPEARPQDGERQTDLGGDRRSGRRRLTE